MKLINKYKELELNIEDNLIKKMSLTAINHYPNEYGGFLVGYYSSDRKSLTITDFIQPTKYKSHQFIFERSTEGIEKKLNELFNCENRQYYVGEWHTHPNGSTNYSSTDLNAMINIANSDSIRITNPILLIISISREKMNQFDFYLYDNKKLLRYE